MAIVAHELDLYTTAGFSVHYKPSQALLVPDLEPLIYQALSQVLRENAILFAVPIVAQGKESYFARLPSIDLREVTSFVQRQGPIPVDGEGRDFELDALLQRQVNKNYKSDNGITPVWRLIILYDFSDKEQFTANFMAHHGISDAASFQILHRSFQKALQALSSSPSTIATESEVEYIIPSTEADIGPSLESIHSLLIPDNPLQADATTYNDWLGNPTKAPPSHTGYVTLTLPSPLVTSFTQECKKNKVAPPAGVNSLIAKVLYTNLPSTIESMDVNVPVDIRHDLPANLDSVMGNFFDAFRTRVFRSDFCAQDSAEVTDIWKPARKISADTRKYFAMANTASSGESYLNIASLKNVPDLQALMKSLIGGSRTESLELAYVGPYVPFSTGNVGDGAVVWQTGKVTVSRCAFALGACLQITVVLHSEGMTIGFAWPTCAIESDLVEKTIDEIRAYFDSLQEHPN